MERLREWTDTKREVVTWALMTIGLVMLMGISCVSVYRGEEPDYWPWVLVLVLGLALGFRRYLAGLRMGRGGISFGEDDCDDEEV